MEKRTKGWWGRGGGAGGTGSCASAGLSSQECLWLGLMSSQRSAVAGAPALLQGPRGRNGGERGNGESRGQGPAAGGGR